MSSAVAATRPSGATDLADKPRNSVTEAGAVTAEAAGSEAEAVALEVEGVVVAGEWLVVDD
jgi:hypothetical protein